MDVLLKKDYFIAFIYGYIVVGFISDLVINQIMNHIQWKTTESYKKMYDENPPVGLDGEKRKNFNWAPRTVGILERIIYTTAIIFGQFVLIGIWVAFKVIGEWSDSSSEEWRKISRKEGKTRIRANNFLIGNALSIIFGILGGVLFRLTIDQNFLFNLIQQSYPLPKP